MPTDKEVKFLVSMAQYISDIIVGTHYLTPEMKEARIAEFCDSLKSFCTTNPKKIVDNCMYAAARATWWAGLPRAVKVIKEVSVVAGNYALKILQIFSNEFLQQFDQILQESPAMVTAEGTLVAVAAQEVSLWQTISKAIWGPPENEINSVDKLMNFLEIEQNKNLSENKEISRFNAYHKFADQEVEEAISHIFKDPNKLHHLFQEKHKLDVLLKTYSREKLIRAIIEELSGKVLFNGKVEDIIVNISGYDVYVRGRMMNGILKIGSLFIK